MKIKVCVPYYLEFESCRPGLVALQEATEHEFIISIAHSYDPAKGRNKMIRSSQKKRQPKPDCDFVIFCDSDMGLKKEHVLKLLINDVDIISAAYKRRGEGELYNCGMWNDTLPGNVGYFIPMENDLAGIIPVDFVGAGLLCVKADVFSNLEYPWFRHTMISSDDDQDELSEDYSFCLLAQQSGFQIFVDLDCVVPHMEPIIPASFLEI